MGFQSLNEIGDFCLSVGQQQADTPVPPRKKEPKKKLVTPAFEQTDTPVVEQTLPVKQQRKRKVKPVIVTEQPIAQEQFIEKPIRKRKAAPKKKEIQNEDVPPPSKPKRQRVAKPKVEAASVLNAPLPKGSPLGYCRHCKIKVPVGAAISKTAKNGYKYLTGHCDQCTSSVNTLPMRG